MSILENTGKTVIRGVTRDKMSRIGERIENTTSGLKSESGRRIESLAAQIRRLGDELESHAEAGKIARELEKTADYLRYRRTSDIAEDAWNLVRTNRAFWVAGAFLGGVLVYSVVRRVQRS